MSAAHTDNPTYRPEDFTGTALPSPTDDLTPPAPEKPIIRLTEGELATQIEQAQQVLNDVGVFTQGTNLVRIAEARELGKEAQRRGIRRNPMQCSLIAVTAEYLREALSEHAIIQRYNAKEQTWKRVNCPPDLAAGVLKRGSHPGLRPLVAVASAPFVREDGSICDEPGYDEQSAVLYLPNGDFSSVTLPERVSVDQAAEALDFLLAPFDEFPYQTPAMRSALAAHILTEAARLAIDRAPMTWYSAQYAGTGKSLLSAMPSLIVHGVEPALRPWVSDGNELRKALFASLLGGDRSIAFDNLPNATKVRAPELCAFLTSETWQDRKLGESSVPTVVNKATVSASGNNITPASDLARRSLVVRLDADTPNLKARTFKIDDLRAFVRAHRVELLLAALTVLRGHHQSQHKGPTPLPSYEQWSRVVRDTLLWLEFPDPCESQVETDDESTRIDDAFQMLGAVFGDRPFTASDVLSQVRSVADMDGKVARALTDGGCSDPQDVIKIGFWLRENRDKFGASYKLELDHDGRGKRASRYRLKATTRAEAVQANLAALAAKCDLA